jgi:hypothetical protein
MMIFFQVLESERIETAIYVDDIFGFGGGIGALSSSIISLFNL